MNTADFLPYRQIHLDYHTSEQITGIGADFDPDVFADTLAQAHVNSITCFARCHHGMLYYQSKRFPERIHPHLARPNLLIEQIEACHARGIRVPVYVTVQWDYYTSHLHPEWILEGDDGRILGTPPFEAGFYRWMNVNSPYADFLKEHVAEIFELMPVDGFFFDIVQPIPSADRYTQEKMRAAGLDPADATARGQFALDSLNAFKRDMTAFVRGFSSECSVFYNAGHIGPRHRGLTDTYTHWELESLPSGHWGYQHFTITQRYARNLGVDTMGHTGKFHTAWGDFQSFKNPAALQFECFRMVAMNCKALIGDQLPPNGVLEPAVYDLIGDVYASIEAKEPWLHGARAVSEIGVFTPEGFRSPLSREQPAAIKGAVRMLEEAGHQFEILDGESDLSPFSLLILPDNIPVDPAFAAKLQAFVDGGGKLLATFESGMNGARDAFALDALGVTLVDAGPRNLAGAPVRGVNYERGDYCEYILPGAALGQGLPPVEHVMYMRGTHVAAQPGAEVLAEIVPAVFDRTWEHFCSHRQSPSGGQPAQPAAVRKGDAIYISSPIFSQYNQNAPLWCKRIVLNALDLLLPDPLVRHDGPSTVLATLNEQADAHRWVLHLLHYIPERRGMDFDVIEDIIPLYDLGVSVRTDRPVTAVTLAPEGDALDFRMEDGRVTFTVPKLHGHQIVALTFSA